MSIENMYVKRKTTKDDVIKLINKKLRENGGSEKVCRPLRELKREVRKLEEYRSEKIF